MFKNLQEYGHEKIVYCFEPNANLKAIIGIHSTALGPAVGGCRMRKYTDDGEALFDVMRLSRAMSLKNAAAGLEAGGGKSVIIADPRTEKKPELLIAFAKAVESLGGIYYTAEDVGMTVNDLNLISKHTKYALGGDESPWGLGDPSMPTAYGAYLGIKASAEVHLGLNSLEGLRVAVQGVGNVGSCLVELLHKDGCDITVADIDESRIKNVVDKFEVKVADPDNVYDVDCDLFSPVALGGTINENTIKRLKCSMVVGPANNQLLCDEDANRLAKRGIYYIPDFVVSCGGVIMGTAEIYKINREQALNKINIVYDNVHEINKIAKIKGINNNEAAIELSLNRINLAGSYKNQ